MFDYTTFSFVMFIVGCVMLGAGMIFREKLPPRIAAGLIMGGVVLAMIFMNISLVLYMRRLNG